jgi:hypothetical protein
VREEIVTRPLGEEIEKKSGRAWVGFEETAQKAARN